MLNQDQIFEGYEGDNWFKRNYGALDTFNPEKDLPLKLMNLYHIRPKTALEIGAANGFRLAVISERYRTSTVGVELSAEAIMDGRSKFPDVKFIRSSASNIPLGNSFELIIVNFVFHWIDRANLFPSMTEIDRLLKDDGYLIIGDFLPSNMTKVHYHHLKDVQIFTYKQNYSLPFIGSGLYHFISLLTSRASSNGLTARASEEDRIGVWLLHKNLNNHYVEGFFK